MKPFDPAKVNAFHFVSYGFNQENNCAEFCYAFDYNIQFVERITFHQAQPPTDPKARRAFSEALRYLHLVLGVSYYKAAAPRSICINTPPITEPCAQFFNQLYLNGLAEFAFQNHLDLRRRVRFPFSPHGVASPESIRLSNRTAIPVGGGKDSVVTIDALKQTGESLVLWGLGDFKPIRDIAQTAALPLIRVTREISPNLMELNQNGAYNGHVPISAIIAFLLPVCALLYDFNTAALSNERSANSGNLIHGGASVNHQYSKSLDFEKDAALFFKQYITNDFNYFSFLRPLSDIHIAKLFSKLEAYHSVFMSCNRAFKLDREKRLKRWCLDCHKCRFTFLVLAPFMDKAKLVELFGANLLDDFEQSRGFDQLLGLDGHKPFECVGEVDESRAAFILLSRNSQWRDDCVVKRFKTETLPQLNDPEQILKSAFSLSSHHQVPDPYLKVLRAYSGV